MNYNKIGNKASKIFFISFIVILLVSTISIYSCSKPVQTKQTIESTIESNEKETTKLEQTEETSVQETSTESNVNEITGNINILTGLELSDKIQNNRPMAIMIENTPNARPQSGLIYADVVFEVVDEGGITRFVSVFSSSKPDLVGPVRSARPYYAEIAAGFDPIYVFWGTHPSFYIVVQNLGLDYLSPLGDTSGASSIIGNFADPGSGEGKDAIRDPSRVAPHNAYVRVPRMYEIAQNLGYSLEGGKSPFHFKNEASENERGDINKITIDVSGNPSYKVNFEYDKQTNTYLRFCGGAPSLDRETSKQITINNVIVLFTDIRNSGDKEGHMVVRTTQGGQGLFFMDGNLIEGTWNRTSALEPFEFKDNNGNNILVNIGQTWVIMVEDVGKVDY